MKIRNLFSILFSILIIFAMSIGILSLVEYYDLISIIIIGAPMLIIMRFADLTIRDYITRERHMQILVSTFLTTLLLIGIFVGSYFFYTNVLNNLDIYKVVIESLNIKSLLPYVK